MDPNQDAGTKVLTVAAFTVSSIGVLLFLARLLYGVDFIDEAFYAATAYRFAMGARPLLDDVDLHQTAALITAPWVRLHLLAFGDTTGLLLSLRVFWALLNGAAALLAFRFLRRLIHPGAAALCATCAFGVMPYMIPAPSYNTLAVTFSAAALSLIGSHVMRPREGRPIEIALAGVLLALAVLAYPSLVVLAVASVLLVRPLCGSWRESRWMLAGGFGAGALMLLGLAPYLSAIPGLVREASLLSGVFGWGTGQSGIVDKALQLIIPLSIAAASSLSFWLAAVVGGVQVARRQVPLWLALGAGVAIPFGFAAPPDVRTLTFSIAVLVSASIVALSAATPRDQTLPLPFRVLRFACVYGIIAGVVLAFTSGIGARYMGLGGAAVMAPAIAVLVARVKASAAKAGLGARTLLGAQLAVPAVLLAGLLFFTWTGFYRDVAPQDAERAVSVGPHAGLRTTDQTASDTEALWEALQRHSSTDSRVFAFHGLPAAYLYTSATPSTRMLWSISYDALGVAEPSDAILRELKDPATAPDLVVRNLGWPNPQVLAQNATSGYDPATDRVARHVAENFRVVEQGVAWELLAPHATEKTLSP